MNNETPELLPCPFCGENDIEIIFGEDEMYSADCGNCAATGPAENNPDAAMWEWNTRVYPTDVQAAIDRAKPKKILNQYKRYGKERGNCPGCSQSIDDQYAEKVCPSCGQRLDWSE